MHEAERLPRFWLAVLTAMVAAILGWGASMLPWRAWTTFAVFTSIVAGAHALTAVLAAIGHRARGIVWRIQSIVALAYLVWLSWNLLTSAAYVAALYGGLGEGVAAALLGAWAIAAFVTLPLSVWGIAATGGVRWGRSTKTGSAAAIVLAPLGLWHAANRAEAAPTIDDQARLVESVQHLMPHMQSHRASLMTEAPARCDQPPAPGVATVFATYVGGDPPGVRTTCRQGAAPFDALSALATQLHEEDARAPVKIDVVTGVQPLTPVLDLVDSLTLRPGFDGVCDGAACLMPWQLVALDQFRGHTPISVVPDLKFGFSAGRVRMALAHPDRPERVPDTIEGLTRIEVASLLLDAEGEVHRFSGGREDDPPLSAATLQAAADDAEDYIARALAPDGRFLYLVNPYTGRESYNGFSLPRQAGTTLVTCELARDRKRARQVAREALAMITTTERVVGELGMFAYPGEKTIKRADLGSTALSSIAFLSCRDLVGDEFDPVIGRITRFLLAMQKPDGGFYPRFDLERSAPVPGPDPLYAVGQAVFGLTLLERLVTEGDHPDLPEPAVVREAVERSMSYIAEGYWNNFLTDFFYMEENWHCLAARASLGHHRHEGYERFCVDYVRYKNRLLFDEGSGVIPELLGGWGFGNVLPTHNTATSGYGEALAAAMAIKHVRGESDPQDDARMRLALSFLLRQELDRTNCFACATGRSMVGGMSEHVGSPFIRIDFVQHAWAAMGHGGRMLGLLPGSSIPAPLDSSP